MKYKIEVHSQGYEDTVMVVEARTLRQAKRSEPAAELAWLEHNKLEVVDCELPFTRTSKVVAAQARKAAMVRWDKARKENKS